MKHLMSLKPDPFEKIRLGEKVYELRLYDEKRKAVSVSDTIVFSRTDAPCEKIEVTVKALHLFDSFKTLYEKLPLEKCGYGKEEVQNASYKDMEAYYSPEEQKNYGVVAIEIELI